MLEINPALLETIMLVCFGSSWPFAVFRTLRTKVVQGKSIVFLFLIFTGYLAGITHKLIGNLDKVIWLYCINGSMVLTEIILYFRYRQGTKEAGQALDQRRPSATPMVMET